MIASHLRARTSLLSVAAVPVIAMSICPLAKKEKTEADVCAHIMKLAEADGEKTKLGDDEKCAKELKEEMATCADRKGAIDCYLQVDEPKDMRRCSAMCTSESESESESKRESTGTGSGAGKIACINGCMSKHGPLIDLSKSRECGKKHTGYGQEAARKACMDRATNSATSSCMRACPK